MSQLVGVGKVTENKEMAEDKYLNSYLLVQKAGFLSSMKPDSYRVGLTVGMTMERSRLPVHLQENKPDQNEYRNVVILPCDSQNTIIDMVMENAVLICPDIGIGGDKYLKIPLLDENGKLPLEPETGLVKVLLPMTAFRPVYVKLNSIIGDLANAVLAKGNHYLVEMDASKGNSMMNKLTVTYKTPSALLKKSKKVTTFNLGYIFKQTRANLPCNVMFRAQVLFERLRVTSPEDPEYKPKLILTLKEVFITKALDIPTIEEVIDYNWYDE